MKLKPQAFWILLMLPLGCLVALGCADGADVSNEPVARYHAIASFHDGIERDEPISHSLIIEINEWTGERAEERLRQRFDAEGAAGLRADLASAGSLGSVRFRNHTPSRICYARLRAMIEGYEVAVIVEGLLAGPNEALRPVPGGDLTLIRLELDEVGQGTGELLTGTLPEFTSDLHLAGRFVRVPLVDAVDISGVRNQGDE